MIKKLIRERYYNKSLCDFCSRKCKSQTGKTVVCGRFNFKINDENIKELFFKGSIVNFGKNNQMFRDVDYITLSDAIKVVANILKDKS